MKTHPLLKNALWLLLFFTTATTNIIIAQNIKVLAESSNMQISGTSNLHPWEIKVAHLNVDMNLSSKQLNALTLKIPVKSLKSGNGIMDGKTYDAFDAKKNPEIIFQLTEPSVVQATDKDIEVVLNGNLTMAGNTKKVAVKASGKATATGYLMSGMIQLKMTDFGIKPPTAIFGTLKTGDAVTVKFNVVLQGQF